MKTYKKVIEQPRLVISYDEFAESPREWSSLGYFITVDNRYNSPDDLPEMGKMIKETGEEAQNQAEHIELIKKELKNSFNEKVLAIYPIVKYEHSGVVYSLGEKHGFDYSNNGFYIITDKSQKEMGVKKKDWEKVIKQELENYNQFIEGDVYKFMLYDKNGEIEDSCGGFYNIEDIRKYLPKEWAKEDLYKYLTN